MKQPKALTRAQKEIVRNNNENPNNWMFVEDLGAYISIINKETKKTKRLAKSTQKRR